MKRNFLPFLLLPLLPACKKDHGEATDTEPPVIRMASPANNQVMTAGQAVVIAGRVTDNVKIDEVHLEITNKTTGTFVTHEHYVPDSAGYTLSRTLVLSPAATYRIKIEAEDTKKNASAVEMTVTAN